MHGGTGWGFSSFLSSSGKLQCAEYTWSILQLYARAWENANIASTLSVIVKKICVPPMPEEISIPFSYGNAFIYFLLLLENEGNSGISAQ